MLSIAQTHHIIPVNIFSEFNGLKRIFSADGVQKGSNLDSTLKCNVLKSRDF